MSAKTKAERLEEMKRLYIQRAFSDIEMAERLGIDRTQVYRYRIELSSEYPIEKDENGRYHIPRSKLISEVKVNLPEALTLYLAARKISLQTRFYHPHAANAVEKLATALRQPMADRLLRTAEQLLEQKKKTERLKIFEVLAQAWVEQRKVRIEYQRLGYEGITRHTISPYLIEPSIWSDSIYIIAKSDFNDKIYPFKLERIHSAFLSNQYFEVPIWFDEKELLKNAWGIWFSEKAPILVKLRFPPNPTVIQRLEESVWHPLEQIEKTEDGGYIWSVEIADWHEMLPWIRGWGADVEVLEPKELREAIRTELGRMAKIYEVALQEAPKPRFFAHCREGEGEEHWQPLVEHLQRTADLAQKLGKDANVAELAYIAGLFHDLGKFSLEFQRRLRGGPRVDHSTAGAREIMNLLKGSQQEPWGRLLVYPILGHHAGLPDYGHESDLEGGTVCARLSNHYKIPDYSLYKEVWQIPSFQFPRRPIKLCKDLLGFQLSFLTRMMYSALVDADFQETETFIRGSQPRGEYSSLNTLLERLREFLKKFENPTSEINRKRNEILQSCIEKGKTESPGFFSITVPTGGGKTLASMAFALHHAVTYGMKRIIYVIPYTTIIEQNAGIFKQIFGEENVLEHHSNFDWEAKNNVLGELADDQTINALKKLKLAAENWDIPIVVTTNVQFFESLFSNRYSQCRKLHNIAQSVIILDEAQMLPRGFLRPVMTVIWELVTNYGASVVFCTATQPGLERFLPQGTKIRELAPNPQKLFEFYKRVEVKNLGILTDEEVLSRLSEHKQVLCIVNTRRHASGLFSGLQGDGNFHLSALMCPVHRKKKLAEIYERLNQGLPCRVVSTTVMEAGIDLDFPVGYRALTGLDSINQAAGRVNREMRQKLGELFIFEPKSDLARRVPNYIKQAVEITQMVLRDFPEIPISIPAIQQYFETLYNFQDPQVFDYKQILQCFASEEGKFDFETAAHRFHIIEDLTQSVIIPFDKEATNLIDRLKDPHLSLVILRRLQPYTVSIFERELEKLRAKGAILTINDSYDVLNPDLFEENYSQDRGLILPESEGGDGLFF